MANQGSNRRLDRRDVVKRIIGGQDDMLVIGGLGGAGFDVTAARGDHDFNFCMHGAMGGGPMMGLGVAIAQPERRVVVVMGDGDFVLGSHSLLTVGAAGVENLAIVVVDNERYAETGGQRTVTAAGVDLAGMAAAAGFKVARTVVEAADVDAAVAEAQTAPGPVFLCFKVADGPSPQVPKTRDGVLMKLRFRQALLGHE
jgi:thiamine pyrophosphate-dependent acetolactate synthase large subunit-like protein